MSTVMRALVQHAGGQDAFDKRVAQVLGTCVLMYKDNDPADSVSGAAGAKTRRMGRRDVALEVVALLLGTDTATAGYFIQTLEVPS